MTQKNEVEKDKAIMYFNGEKYQLVTEDEYTRLKNVNGPNMVRCDDGTRIYYVPKVEFARILMGIKKTPDRKFVRYKTGAELYDMSEHSFSNLAREAKAIHRVGTMVLVNVEIVDAYLQYFREEH